MSLCHYAFSANNYYTTSRYYIVEGCITYTVINKRNVTRKFKTCMHSVMANINLGKNVANKTEIWSYSDQILSFISSCTNASLWFSFNIILCSILHSILFPIASDNSCNPCKPMVLLEKSDYLFFHVTKKGL